MTRLIDADALIEIFDKDKYDRVRNEYQSGYNDGLLHAEVVADDQPTVDAVPVVHGTWVNADDDYSVRACSVCGETYRMPFDFDGRMYPHKYCPNCGARMDEK